MLKPNLTENNLSFAHRNTQVELITNNQLPLVTTTLCTVTGKDCITWNIVLSSLPYTNNKNKIQFVHTK